MHDDFFLTFFMVFQKVLEFGEDERCWNGGVQVSYCGICGKLPRQQEN